MNQKIWVIVPAAGIGARVGAITPKQYLLVDQRPVIEHTLDCLLTYPRFEKIVVALNAEDVYWPQLSLSKHPKIFTVKGGAERHHSVLHGLLSLEKQAQPNDWVLVHDAVRPCLQHSDLDKLIDTLGEHPVGGLLGAPLSNTIKRVNPHKEIVETIDRAALWQAFTPQMFRFELLRNALQKALDNNQIVTDEASAVEQTGSKPLFVMGRLDNIKITTAEDLRLAAFYRALTAATD